MLNIVLYRSGSAADTNTQQRDVRFCPTDDMDQLFQTTVALPSCFLSELSLHCCPFHSCPHSCLFHLGTVRRDPWIQPERHVCLIFVRSQRVPASNVCLRMHVSDLARTSKTHVPHFFVVFCSVRASHFSALFSQRVTLAANQPSTVGFAICSSLALQWSGVFGECYTLARLNHSNSSPSGRL